MADILKFPKKNIREIIFQDEKCDILYFDDYKDKTLQFIKNVLDENDYLDFLEGIQDKEVYNELDEDMQELIDNYCFS
jgi:hypothetical protein